MTDFQALESVLKLDSKLSQPSKARLSEFVGLVQKWNPAINVIGKSTAPKIWERHIIDSAQLFCFAQSHHKVWLDIGSGGGFPGVVLAILAAEVFPDLQFTLVESDRRKAVFLSEAARTLGLAIKVHPLRIEEVAPVGADVISARALAPLEQLCQHAQRHLAVGGVCVFPKGETAEAEIEAAKRSWGFSVARHVSHTDSKATILLLKDLHRA